MSGKTIVVNGVDWSTKAVKKVTLLGSDHIYREYLLKSGRTQEATGLRKLLNALYEADLLDKCTSMFYLASGQGEMENIIYDVITHREITQEWGTYQISEAGTATSNGRLIDAGKYDFANKGFMAVFVVSVAATSDGYDWGGLLADDKGYVFQSYGYTYEARESIVRWCGDAGDFRTTYDDAPVLTEDDPQEKTGPFLWYAKGTQGRYIHNDIDLKRTINESTLTAADPYFFNYSWRPNRPSTATFKMYATFNNDLSDAEIDTIKEIFDKYWVEL